MNNSGVSASSPSRCDCVSGQWHMNWSAMWDFPEVSLKGASKPLFFPSSTLLPGTQLWWLGFQYTLTVDSYLQSQAASLRDFFMREGSRGLFILRAVLCYMCVLTHFSHVWLFASLWTVACKAPLSIGFSRQEYLSGLPCPPPVDLPDPGIELTSLVSPVL